MATRSKSECFKIVVSVEKVPSLNSAFRNMAPTSEGLGLKTIRFKNSEGPNTDVGILLDFEDGDSERFAKERLLDTVRRTLELTFSGASEATSEDSSTATEGSQSLMTSTAGETSLRSEDRSSNWEDMDDEVEIKEEIIEESEEDKISVSTGFEVDNIFASSSDEEEEEQATPTNINAPPPTHFSNSFQVSSLESTPPKDDDLNRDEEEEDCEKSRTILKTPATAESTPKTPLGRSAANVAPSVEATPLFLPSAETTPSFLAPKKTPKTPSSAAPSTRLTLGSSSSSEDEGEDLLKVASRTPFSATASVKKTRKRRSAASSRKSLATSVISGRSVFSDSSDSGDRVQKAGPKPSSSAKSKPKTSTPNSNSKTPAAPSRRLVLYSSDSDVDVEQESVHSETSAALLKKQAAKPPPRSWTNLAEGTNTAKKNQDEQAEAAGTSAAASVQDPTSESQTTAAQSQTQTKRSAKKVVRVARKNVTKNSEAGDENDDSQNETTPSRRLLRSALDKSHLVEGIVFPKGKRAI